MRFIGEKYLEQTFIATIDRELGWAENIGMNTMMVYLHSVARKQDPEGFKSRMDKFLSIRLNTAYQHCLCFLMIAGT